MNTKFEQSSLNFIEEIIEKDIKKNSNTYHIRTRFPPEPNGFLHLGHAKAICLNFGLAEKYNGKTNLRFDDTNPTTEETRYVEAIKEDIRWLGFTWEKECYSSDYFTQLFEWALQLIEKGLAYVDDSPVEAIIQQRGDINIPGKESPFRNRNIAENRTLFINMKEGKYKEGEKVLRAKIDMKSPNIHMRDPILYRIKYAQHHRTGDTWCIYPMYDYAHGQSDSIENITHSICSLEFVAHRMLYDWFIEKLAIFPSKQYEFARLNITYTLMSKRKLLQLVTEKIVTDWDDPRMPTLAAIRRRGYTPEAIKNFCTKIGIAKRDNIIELALLEHCVREDLNKKALRVMAVLDPVKLIITNYEEGKTEYLTAENNPENEKDGTRSISFSKELWIEREDFMQEPVGKFFRLSPKNPVRLKHAYIIAFKKSVYDSEGKLTEIHCHYIPESKSGNDTSGIKVKSTIHWVDANNSTESAIHLYDKLFIVPEPAKEEKPLHQLINPNSLIVIAKAYLEKCLENADHTKHYQFIRKGYFYLDKLSTPDNLIFNSTVNLKDNWGKSKQHT